MAELTKNELPKRAWYVLRAISGKEAKVKEVLDGAIRNTDLGKYVFQVLVPTEKIVSVKNGKKVVKERNLYGGYVFVDCILTGEVNYELRNTTNVIDFLKGRGKDAKPDPVSEADIRRMLGAADELIDKTDEGMDFMVGETVKVIKEPFTGFPAVIEEVDRAKKKLKVMVKIFGRKTSLELDTTEVERE